MREHVTKVFSFEELDDNAQETALDEVRSSPDWLDWDWYDSSFYDFLEELEEIGISSDEKPMRLFDFDLDRSDYIALNKPFIEDKRKLLKAAGVDLRVKAARDILNWESDLSISTYHRGIYGSYTEISADNEDIQEKVEELVSDKLHEFKTRLRDEYESMFDNEYIKDHIIANEMEFTEDGKRFLGK